MPVKKQRKQNNKKRENKSKESTTQVRKSTAREKVFKLSQFIKPLVNYQGAKDVDRGGRSRYQNGLASVCIPEQQEQNSLADHLFVYIMGKKCLL